MGSLFGAKSVHFYQAISVYFILAVTNGRIEGINNKIKVLNRVAYGYRNFKNYKNRILLHFAYNLDSRKKHCFITRNVIIEGFRHIITRYILFCITREECYCIGIYGLPRYTFRECRVQTS